MSFGDLSRSTVLSDDGSARISPTTRERGSPRGSAWEKPGKIICDIIEGKFDSEMADRMHGFS